MFYFFHIEDRGDYIVTLNTDINITTNRFSSTLSNRCNPSEELLVDAILINQYQNISQHMEAASVHEEEALLATRISGKR